MQATHSLHMVDVDIRAISRNEVDAHGMAIGLCPHYFSEAAMDLHHVTTVKVHQVLVVPSGLSRCEQAITICL